MENPASAACTMHQGRGGALAEALGSENADKAVGGNLTLSCVLLDVAPKAPPGSELSGA